MITRKKINAARPMESTMILGDLTCITQISRSGNVVTLHGDTDRHMVLGTVEQAVQVWEALVSQASEAVSDDRQFFCVSFGQSEPTAAATMH